MLARPVFNLRWLVIKTHLLKTLRTEIIIITETYVKMIQLKCGICLINSQSLIQVKARKVERASFKNPAHKIYAFVAIIYAN